MHVALRRPNAGRPGGLLNDDRCDATIHDTTITKTIRRKNRFIVVQSHSG